MPTKNANIDENKRKKKKKLRYNEYYDIQEVFDKLYEDSKNGNTFTNLLEIILDERNIKLAYRNIKRNKGSRTKGSNGTTIERWEKTETDGYVAYIRERLKNYMPMKVLRCYIPKGNGKTRPLGIPTIEDRLIQQCIKQVLEPICEAKFHPYSFGFRPNRSTENAIAQFSSYVNVSKTYYVVDIDIKGFFDNVNHGKLLKQMWTLGIRDKRLICIISKMLKAEIEGEGVPTKGTPQGGILSPLLSNIVLNELDWWISDQWLTVKTSYPYSCQRPDGRVRRDRKYEALRKRSNLKEIYIVRYADDFKIMCKSAEVARKMYVATKAWLKERLMLDISEDKSKITDLRHSSSEFLGFRFKAKYRHGTYVLHSHMSEKAIEKCITNLKEKVKDIRNIQDGKTVSAYNSMVLGCHNYYRIATHISCDFSKIAYKVNIVIKKRLTGISTTKGVVAPVYVKFYKNNYKKIFIMGRALFPIADIKFRRPINFNQEKCNYTLHGRGLLHDNLKNYDLNILRYIMENPVMGRSTEYNDNRISLYVGQYGNCGVTGKPLQIGEMETHHKRQVSDGGKDEYRNLIFLSTDVHKLIHATNIEIIREYMGKVKPNIDMLKKINSLRTRVGNIVINKD